MEQPPATAPKFFVFVLMPFDETFKDVYGLGIKAACVEAGAYCERVDEQIFQESILERIYNQISKADLIVADMSGRNPNVFYEVGYAHALGKHVILLTNKAEDIPFDLKHYPHIVYGSSIIYLKGELTKRIKWGIANPEEAKDFFSGSLELVVGRARIVDNPTRVTAVTTDKRYFSFALGIHNSIERRIAPVSFQFAIILPEYLTVRASRFQNGSAYSLTEIEPPNSFDTMYIVNESFGLFPDSWEPFHLLLFGQAGDFDITVTEHPFTCRVLTESGTTDFRFIAAVTLATKDGPSASK